MSEPVRRRLRFERKSPERAEIQGFDCDVHGKAQLIVLRDAPHCKRQFMDACTAAGIYAGAIVFALPEGGEIEVWEEI